RRRRGEPRPRRRGRREGRARPRRRQDARPRRGRGPRVGRGRARVVRLRQRRLPDRLPLSLFMEHGPLTCCEKGFPLRREAFFAVGAAICGYLGPSVTRETVCATTPPPTSTSPCATARRCPGPGGCC